MKNIVRSIICVCILGITLNSARAQQQSISQKVDALLTKMTLAEKIGQLNQYNGDWEATGPITTDVGNKLDAIKKGEVGSILNIVGVEHTRLFQEAAMKSRLKIPLL